MLHRALSLTLLLFALPAVAPAGIPIVGQVLGPDGEPEARVGVRLEPIPPTYERAVLRLEGQPGPEPAVRTRTRADGTFELATPEAGMWKVVVSAPGMLTAEFRLVPLVDAAVLPAVKLVPAADLEVRLVDAEGKPRPGAVGAVILGGGGSGWRPQLRLAAAGEDGVARLPVGKDEKIQLEVLADGHPLAIFEVFDETSVTIDLPAGVAGVVRIIDQHKRPLAGAVAFQGSALLPLGLSDEEGHLPLVLQAEEPPSVRVSTANRWNGSFELDFGQATQASPLHRSKATQASPGGETKPRDLRLAPPSTIRGRVLDLSNRDPVAGALVWAVRGELAVTDKKGQYALDDGVYKSRSVKAAAAGYQPGGSELGEDPAGEAAAIGLAPAAALSGKVVDSEGTLLAGVEIELTPLPQGGGFTSTSYRMARDGWRGRTSDRGVFRVAGLPAELGYRLTFKRRGFAPHTLDVPPLEAFESRSELRVVLEPGRLAFGRVVDEDDVPVAGAEVALEEPPPSGDPMAAMRMMRWRRDPPDEPTWLTDAEGRFEIADLAAGRYDLEVRASGFAPARVPGVRITDDHPRADFGTVVLVPGASIEGRVTDPDGVAVAGAEISIDTGRHRSFISARHSSEEQVQARTDDRGRFVVEDLLPGQPVTLFVTKEGYGSESVAGLLPPPEEPLAIVLRVSARLKGKVVDQQGDPIRDARIMAHVDRSVMMASGTMSQRQRPVWAQTGADGSFVVEDVEPGTLQVTANAEGYQQQVHAGIELAAGTEREIDFVLEAGAVVEGTVTTADGEPVVQSFVNVTEPVDRFSAGRQVSAGGQTDVEGRYRVTGAPVGPATISVHHNHSQQLEKSIELRPGTNVVDLVLDRGFEIAGQVVDPDGNPMAGASLMVQPAMQPGMTHYFGGSPQAVSAGDGTFTLTGVKAGKYTVNASRDGYAPARSEVVEVAGDVTGLLLELSRGAALKGRVLGLDFDELGSLALVAFSQTSGMRQGRVDFEAEYAFDSLAPGQWHIQARVASSGRSTNLQVEIPDGVPEVLKDIEFGTGFTLTGIVLDGGQPLAGVNVSAGGGAGSSGFGMTGAHRRFRIENLKAGSYRVMVMAGMGMQHTEVLELAGDHELRIEISTGTVSGFVLDFEGEPLAGVAVGLQQLDAGDAAWSWRFTLGNRVNTDSRGFFQVPKVRQGSWRVVATKAGYGPGETTVAVAGGGSPEVEIRLTPTEGVSFEVVLESGLTVPSVQVSILAPSGPPLASGNYPVADGKVRVSTVPPGSWELVVQAADSASTRFAVTAPGDQGRLVLPIGGILQIEVPELEQVPMASVRLTGPDGKPFVSSLGVMMMPGEWLLSAGKTTVPGLVPGVWSFTVEHEGRTWSGSATVTSGVTTEVNVP